MEEALDFTEPKAHEEEVRRIIEVYREEIGQRRDLTDMEVIKLMAAYGAKAYLDGEVKGYNEGDAAGYGSGAGW